MKLEEMKPIFEVFDNIKKEEMKEFFDDFSDCNWELAHELMTELEEKVNRKVNDLLDWRRQKEICFFSDENEMIIRDTIRTSIRRVIVNELMNNELNWERTKNK